VQGPVARPLTPEPAAIAPVVEQEEAA
jgi:hypothetical protein